MYLHNTTYNTPAKTEWKCWNVTNNFTLQIIFFILIFFFFLVKTQILANKDKNHTPLYSHYNFGTSWGHVKYCYFSFCQSKHLDFSGFIAQMACSEYSLSPFKKIYTPISFSSHGQHMFHANSFQGQNLS